MRCVVFSDIHGNSYTLEIFLKEIKKINYDKLFFLGDIFGYYYNQHTILLRLLELHNFIWLLGNHDLFFLRLKEDNNNEFEQYLTNNYGHSYMLNRSNRYLSECCKIFYELDFSAKLKCGDLKIGAFHGTPINPLEGRLYPNKDITNATLYGDYDIIFLGHTHCRMARKFKETVILNPGSLGQPRDGNQYGYMIVDTDKREAVFQNIYIDETPLYRQIKEYDPNLVKLKEVLERKNKSEKDPCYCYQW